MPEPDATPPLWPFPAAQEITEVLEWRTDLLQARAVKQAGHLTATCDDQLQLELTLA